MAYARKWVVSNAANKAAGTCPCKDCGDRKPACAGHCDRYKAWKQRVSDLRSEMLASDRGERDASALCAASFDRAVAADKSRAKYFRGTRFK